MKRFQSPCLHHVRINGRDTSITVEPEFWKQFRLMTMERQTTIGKLLAEIDRLSSGMTMRTRRRLARLSASQRRLSLPGGRASRRAIRKADADRTGAAR
jgi:predicted DNA-binding ribbon-helix-helix protein